MRAALAFIAVLLFAVIASPAFAEESPTCRTDTYIDLGGHSHHWRTYGKHYNEANGGFGMEHDLPNCGAVMVGVYDNSFRRLSPYAGYAPQTWGTEWHGLNLSSHVLFGMIGGYGSDETARNHPGPLVMPYVSAGYRPWNVKLLVGGVPGILMFATLQVRIP